MVRLANALLTGAIALALGSIANAQATRTWVSGVGDDTNPCSRTAPCKTWAGAISKTVAGGEIDALDPGGFGAVTITKSITLDGGGGQAASILVTGSNGVNIVAQPTDVVTIRNLAFDGLLGNGSSPGTAGTNGIRFASGKSLHIENVVIFGFSQNGVLADFTGNAITSPSTITLQNTTILMDSGGTSGVSVLNSSTSTAPLITEMNNVRILSANTGLLVSSTAIVNVENSVLALNGNGVQTVLGGAQVNIFNSQLNSNATAIASSAGCVVRSFGNTLLQNGTAFNLGGGTIASDGQNNPGGNGTNGAPNGTLTKM